MLLMLLMNRYIRNKILFKPTTELISARKTSLKHNNKDLSRLR